MPFLVDNGFRSATQPDVDLPSFYYAADTAFNADASPYAPRAWQRLQRQLDQPVFPFLYPPPSLLFFAPFAWFSYDVVKLGVLVVNHLSLLLVLFLLLFRIFAAVRTDPPPDAGAATGLRVGPFVLPLLVLYALQFHPVAVTLGHGQINLVVLVLLAVFWEALRSRRRAPLTALPLAGAILLKTYPALFVPLLLIRRRWRTAGWTVAYVAAVAALSWFVLPRQVWSDWLLVVLPSGGYAAQPLSMFSPAIPWNQSINGFAARLFLNPVYAAHPNPLLAKLLPTVAAAAVVGLLVWVAVRLTRRRETRYLNDEFVTVLLAMYLVAPLSWEHHLVFVLPAAMLALIQLFAGKLSVRSSVGIGLVVFVLAWPMDFLFRIRSTGPESLLVSLKFYAVVALWVYFLRRLVRISRGETLDAITELTPELPRPTRRPDASLRS